MAGKVHIVARRNSEELFSEFATVLERSPGTLFEQETILVPTGGMEKWLSLSIASRFGICFNVSFLYPRNFISAAARWASLDEKPWSVEPEETVWQLYRWLSDPATMSEPHFSSPAGYCEGDAAKVFGLAKRLASLFDKYSWHRRGLIESWGNNRRLYRDDDDEIWQMALWRLLPWGETLSDLYDGIKSAVNGEKGKYPSRISVFGVSTLPVIEYTILELLASVSEVTLYLNAPYDFGESEKTFTQFDRWKKTGRQFFGWVIGRPGTILEPPTDDGRMYNEDETVTVQSLELLKRELSGCPDSLAGHFHAYDGSIEIVSCHTPLREMEILRDHILDAFESDIVTVPEDILVLAPDISVYKPYIESVFARVRIPYSFSDSADSVESELFRAFLAVVNLPAKRYSLSSVMDMLSFQVIRDKFGIDSADLEEIVNLAGAAGVRWGISQTEVNEDFDIPGPKRNTWRFGINRLLIGCILDGRVEFRGVLPLPLRGTEAIRIAGALGAMFAVIERLPDLLGGEKNCAEWSVTFRSVCDSFFGSETTDEEELGDLYGLFERIGSYDSGPAGISLELMVSYLKETALGQGSSRRFLSGGISFCTLQPMRSIPAKFIALIGMNDGDFPRLPPEDTFNLMARYPEPLDRNDTDMDRFAFLETVFSAEKKLYISYLGRDSRTNTDRLPSPLVSDIIDFLEDRLAVMASAAEVKEMFPIRHPLFSFSPHYAVQNDKWLYGYDTKSAQTDMSYDAAAGVGHGKEEQEEGKRPASITPLSVDDILIGIKKPHQNYFKKAGILLPEPEKGIDDREPFSMNKLVEWRLFEEIGMSAVTSEGWEDNFNDSVKRLTGEGKLPEGRYGAHLIAEQRAFFAEFFEERKKLLNGRTIDKAPASVSLRCASDGGHYTVTGNISFVAGDLLYVPVNSGGSGDSASVDATNLLTAYVEWLLVRHGSEKGAGISGFAVQQRKGRGYACEAVHAACLDFFDFSDVIHYYRAVMEKPLVFDFGGLLDFFSDGAAANNKILFFEYFQSMSKSFGSAFVDDYGRLSKLLSGYKYGREELYGELETLFRPIVGALKCLRGKE